MKDEFKKTWTEIYSYLSFPKVDRAATNLSSTLTLEKLKKAWDARDPRIIRCPNCHKEHPLARMAARVTCVCNYVFDPRKEK